MPPAPQAHVQEKGKKGKGRKRKSKKDSVSVPS